MVSVFPYPCKGTPLRYTDLPLGHHIIANTLQAGRIEKLWQALQLGCL